MIPAGATFGEYHTYRDLSMIPKHKIIIAPPIPKFYRYDVPGVDGDIDLTKTLHGRIAYNNRKGTLDFLVLSGVTYLAAYRNCLSVFNGARITLVLDDEPGVTYTGRFNVNQWKSNEGISQISIDYNIDPPDIENEV